MLKPSPTLIIPQDEQTQPATQPVKWLHHRLHAGFPSPASDYEEAELDMHRYLIRNAPATFMFTVTGNSMIGAHIDEGDKVLVDRSITPKHNDIVVAVVDQEYTLKRLYQQHGKIELRAENPNFPSITFKEYQELQIWGVVVGLIRKF